MVECPSVYQKVVALISGQGTYLGVGVQSQVGVPKGCNHWISLSLKLINMSSGEKKKVLLTVCKLSERCIFSVIKCVESQGSDIKEEGESCLVQNANIANLRNEKEYILKVFRKQNQQTQVKIDICK